VVGYTRAVRALVAVLLVSLAGPAWPAAGDGRRVVDYEIDVALDPVRHELRGDQRVRWRNTTGVATSEIWLHLYLNAFASSRSTMMTELARESFGRRRPGDDGWGWTRITRIALAGGVDLIRGMSFERPDDGNPDDFTVARVALPYEIRPGESVELELEFEARLPRVVLRTGYAGDFHMVAQWFPKLGVFEGERGWNCHQYHAASEFYADFGSYNVALTVPRGWVVGATGEPVSRQPVGSEDRLVLRAREVHDFAWATAPPSLMSVVETDFEPGRDIPRIWLDRAAAALGRGAGELELPPMSIRLLVPRSQEALAPRMIRAVRLGLAWFGLHLGPYPYPQLTVVSPPPEARAAGGMEYPTMFTTGASRLDAFPPRSWRRDIESVTVHELGHQYFQGVLASNEVEQAWLDEGLVSWAENRCLDDIIADRLAPEIRNPLTWETDQLLLSRVEQPLVVDRPVWEHRLIAESYLASYDKTALAIRTLEGVLGEDRLLRAMRAYVDDFRFRHPTGDDLRAVLERETGHQLTWLFDGVLRNGLTPDWAVLAVRHRRVGEPEGMVWRDGRWHEADERGETGPWRVDIELGRRSELVGPVEVELRWESGRVERRTWDGRARWVRWTEESSERLAQVAVDPDFAWALESRRSDNHWRDEPAKTGPLWWLGDALRLIGLVAVPGS
jgi:hypothetical protein